MRKYHLDVLEVDNGLVIAFFEEGKDTKDSDVCVYLPYSLDPVGEIVFHFTRDELSSDKS